MSKIKVMARFAIDSSYHPIEIDFSKFFKTSEFEDEIFGVYLDNMIAIEKASLNQ